MLRRAYGQMGTLLPTLINAMQRGVGNQQPTGFLAGPAGTSTNVALHHAAARHIR